jgi:hypothetical protein
METAIEKLGPDAASKVNLVFITIDPERDTQELLKGYVENFGSTFIGLTGTPQQIADVARAYRVYYQKVPGKDGGPYLMDHSSIVYLLDRNGRFVTHFTHEAKAEAIAAAAVFRAAACGLTLPVAIVTSAIELTRVWASGHKSAGSRSHHIEGVNSRYLPRYRRKERISTLASSMYQAYEFHRQRPIRVWANTLEQVYSSLYNPLTDTWFGKSVAASETRARLTQELRQAGLRS